MFEKQKQEQNVQENSLAVQAGGNVSIVNGLQYSDVKDLFITLLENNFPKLQEIAQKVAYDNVQKLLVEFKDTLRNNEQNINVSQFTNPDVQYSINDAVQASARKGEKIDLNTLSELLVHRLKIDTNDLISNICGEAINVLPKLDNKQIAFLTLFIYLSSVKHEGIRDMGSLENKCREVVDFVKDGFDISMSNIEYLRYTGVLTRLPLNLGNSNKYDKHLRQFYNFIDSMTNEELDTHLSKHPSLYAITNYYNKAHLYQISLTPIGQIIALINLKRILPDIDYKQWIN